MEGWSGGAHCFARPRGSPDFCYTKAMIKKTTIATFRDGGYKGVYDWSGGIPLAVGETVTIIQNNQTLVYRVEDKQTRIEDGGEDQVVTIEYYLGYKSGTIKVSGRSLPKD